ncbi:MAG: hypothetical protein HF314_02735 [Ignavibacteria bacterium]|jgi:hypothetical protein|nr:hypothetical protein [Ignavibacteria bacterium]MCU7501964.1 hypothetical protein [Ignavibacteria bacterium]MCU7516932.1 hypothetical protein [Ignavibacteria bacterium]
MLDKIINIKATPQYQKEKGIYNNLEGSNLEKILDGTVKNLQGSSNSSKDSIKFSPAAHFLARLGWRLKDLAFESADRLLISFTAGGFDVRTEVDFLNFHAAARQFYEISSSRALEGQSIRAQIGISAAKKSKSQPDEKAAVDFPGLQQLFGRIFQLELSGEIDKYYSLALRELMDGIKETLIEEFDYINGALFTLIDRISPGKLAPKYVFLGDERNEPLIIEKIKVLND